MPERRALALLLTLPALAAAHQGVGFPLPVPPRVVRPHDPKLRPFRPYGFEHPEVLRTRVVENAIRAAGGWNRWKQVQALYLRTHRRSFDELGNVVSHVEVDEVHGRNRFYRYWEEDNLLQVATLEGQEFRLVQPALSTGHPRLVEVRRLMDKELFWRSHPFLFYRPGIRTRYLGLTYTRGIRAQGLLATFAPGASPYREVRYLFDPLRGDLLRATAIPALEGEPPEEIHFSGRVTHTSGLRLPRRREVLVDGIVREVVTTLEVATRAPWLPPGGFSKEARQRRQDALNARERVDRF